jgi:hypothetical protein
VRGGGCEWCFAELDVQVGDEVNGLDAESRLPRMRVYPDRSPVGIDEPKACRRSCELAGHRGRGYVRRLQPWPVRDAAHSPFG